MTADERQPRRTPRRPGPGGVILASIAGFLLVLALLSSRLAAGRDPALGSQPAPAPQPRKVVVVRKIVTRVIVEHPAEPAKPATVQTRAPAAAPAPAPAATPAPAAAPPPAPAPAPPTTRAS